MDVKGLICFVCLLWKQSYCEIVSQPFIGQQEQYARIDSLDVEETDDGGRVLKVTFTATDIPQMLWEIGGKPVMYYDRNFASSSSYNTASLSMGPTTRTVKFTVILQVYQESILISMSSATPGHYPVSNHSLSITPGETFTYSSDDIRNVNVDAVLSVDDVSQYNRLRLDSMLMMPDYCSRPIQPLFGFPSSNPGMLQRTTANGNHANNSVATRIRITSVSRQSQKQGILVIGSNFDANSPSDPISNVRTIRRILFKPAPLFQDFILRNTVTFIGWQNDVVVNLHDDADVHLFAIGNPTPDIKLAKNGVDISTMVERRDIREAYFKHSIFRFRNVTNENSGRYISTATSGDGRLKQTFTLYVRSPCNPGT